MARKSKVLRVRAVQRLGEGGYGIQPKELEAAAGDRRRWRNRGVNCSHQLRRQLPSKTYGSLQAAS